MEGQRDKGYFLRLKRTPLRRDESTPDRKELWDLLRKAAFRKKERTMDNNYFFTMVASTAILFVAYHADGGILEVRFRNANRSYIYSGVPLQLAVSFVTAVSVGAFYNIYVKANFPLVV